MTGWAAAQVAFYFIVLTVLAVPLGLYMARVYTGRAVLAQKLFGGLERFIYRISGVRSDEEMGWKRYAVCLLLFNLLGLVLVYFIQRLQGGLPFNPTGLDGVEPRIAFNTAVSFVSNTNWQAYSGETTMSYLSQMLALTVQNFLSAATGMAALIGLTRGFIRHNSKEIGNFWVDLTRSTLYILLPLALILAIVLVSQGVVQTLDHSQKVELLQPVTDNDGNIVTTQEIAVGPFASQIAIKQLGTNGGGAYNTNSAHPLENSTPFSNLLEMLALLLIPAALCFTFGTMVNVQKHGWALYAVMLVIILPMLWLCVSAEQTGNPALATLGVDQSYSHQQPGGNMEGKEVRFGITNSALWATTTTAASNGSVNSMHDSFTPLGGFVPMWLMQLGEVVFGGVGSGLYGLLMFAIVAVFISGLMVGRTPEYLGKKLEAFEMKMASLVILIPPAAVLIGTAIACVTAEGISQAPNPGAHGFSEILYAFSSGSNNNGSAFAGLDASNLFYTVTIAIAMLMGRFWTIIPVLAIAGALANKKSIPVTAGTLRTSSPLFVFLLVGIVMLVGALTFIPALALGPIVEHLLLGH
jgi:K+-transporting ATPase ATPase A chain